jgi:hypothetical protein
MLREHQQVTEEGNADIFLVFVQAFTPWTAQLSGHWAL